MPEQTVTTTTTTLSGLVIAEVSQGCCSALKPSCQAAALTRRLRRDSLSREQSPRFLFTSSLVANFRCICSGSDGGGLNIYPHVERGLKSLLEEQIANGDVTEVEEDPESQDACEDFGNTQTELGEPVRETSKSMKRRQKQKQKKERSRQERVDINQVCDGSEPIQSQESTAPPNISSTTSEPTASTLASTVTATVRP